MLALHRATFGHVNCANDSALAKNCIVSHLSGKEGEAIVGLSTILHATESLMDIDYYAVDPATWENFASTAYHVHGSARHVARVFYSADGNNPISNFFQDRLFEHFNQLSMQLKQQAGSLFLKIEEQISNQQEKTNFQRLRALLEESDQGKNEDLVSEAKGILQTSLQAANISLEEIVSPPFLQIHRTPKDLVAKMSFFLCKRIEANVKDNASFHVTEEA